MRSRPGESRDVRGRLLLLLRRPPLGLGALLGFGEFRSALREFCLDARRLLLHALHGGVHLLDLHLAARLVVHAARAARTARTAGSALSAAEAVTTGSALTRTAGHPRPAAGTAHARTALSAGTTGSAAPVRAAAGAARHSGAAAGATGATGTAHAGTIRPAGASGAAGHAGAAAGSTHAAARTARTAAADLLHLLAHLAARTLADLGLDLMALEEARQLLEGHLDPRETVFDGRRGPAGAATVIAATLAARAAAVAAVASIGAVHATHPPIASAHPFGAARPAGTAHARTTGATRPTGTAPARLGTVAATRTAIAFARTRTALTAGTLRSARPARPIRTLLRERTRTAALAVHRAPLVPAAGSAFAAFTAGRRQRTAELVARVGDRRRTAASAVVLVGLRVRAADLGTAEQSRSGDEEECRLRGSHGSFVFLQPSRPSATAGSVARRSGTLPACMRGYVPRRAIL